MRVPTKSLILGLLACFTADAWAVQSFTWDLSKNPDPAGTKQSYLGYQGAAAGGAQATVDANLLLSGYSDTATNAAKAKLLDSAYVTPWGTCGNIGFCGLGIQNTSPLDAENTAPNHAADSKVFQDGFLLSFGSATKLSSIQIGWAAEDYGTPDKNGNYPWKEGSADIVVYAYTGTGVPSLMGKQWSVIENSSDWTKIVVADNLVENGTKTISTNTYSSYWLVTEDTKTASPNNDSYADYFKLKSVAGDSKANLVPEPVSIALMGLGLAGLAVTRRRRC